MIKYKQIAEHEDRFVYNDQRGTLKGIECGNRVAFATLQQGFVNALKILSTTKLFKNGIFTKHQACSKLKENNNNDN